VVLTEAWEGWTRWTSLLSHDLLHARLLLLVRRGKVLRLLDWNEARRILMISW
jgi:hypothetical protein